ncbi:MAG: hypothetical protein E5X33_27150 [Mesorhizobium sp.]|uniref:hypothetical protein n=1 Tax=Mesorhizobium sp. TaxID=1871066 RepID=UPI0011FC81E3|nr:hypothetical protein [Mesorhizobium sp.]TIR17122.1 MAG: hypothetical protein E5X33_27150 [Mesorhizobium sp.]
MTKDFETFRDPLLSLFQSAAVDVGKKIDQQSASRGGPRSQIASSAKSDLEAIATSIARRERGEEDDATPAARDLSKLGIARACAEWGLRYLKAVTLRIREFSGRTILLSHHPLFSAFSAIGAPGTDGKRTAVNPNLLTAFERLSAEKAIAAWFWGHEHNLAIYNPFAGLSRGRCVGHGAVPVSVLDQIYEPLGDLGDTPTIIPRTELGKGPGVYNHGYAMLAFRGKACRAEYFELAGGKKNLIFGEDFE